MKPPPKTKIDSSEHKPVTFSEVGEAPGHRVVIFGPGGIGKTSLACTAPGPVAFIDLEKSLAILKEQLVHREVKLPKLVPANSWKEMRASLRSPGWNAFKTIVVDTGTKAEELAVSHTIANVKHEKGHSVHSVEGYGFGKGLQHVYETFIALLSDLESHTRQGRHVILICHDCTSEVPNPEGEDWLRYEPRLQSPNSGKASIRFKVREWCDHLLFYGYDVAVNENGKGVGSGTKTIYTSERPFCMAKSRTCQDSIPVEGNGEGIWEMILRG